jgi:CRISPR-associated protein Cas6/Cse3/CasE subtype I-E
MYHSHLLINVGDNPDQPDWRICRRWLRNLCRVHQRLCMAFPSSVSAPAAETDDDGDVHQPRNHERGFLFRIDYPVDAEAGCRRPVIIVQSTSAREPDWDKAFGLTKGTTDDRGRPIGNAAFLLAAPPQVREVSIELDGDALVLNSPKQHHRVRAGDQVRFRLRANPVCTSNGKRHRPRIAADAFNAGPAERDRAFIKAHHEWLNRKLDAAAENMQVSNLVTGWAFAWRTKHEPEPSQRMQWWSVLFEGSFRVRDVAVLKSLLESGIGSAKAFGFGLLSITPVR